MGEFWDSPNATLLRAYTYAKAVLTGETYKAGPDEHAIVKP